MNFYQNLEKMKSKTIKLSIFLVALAIVFSSCKKDKSNPRPDPESAILAVFHASTSIDSVNFYLDSKKVNKKLVGSGDSLGYVEILTGERSAEIKNKEDKSLLKKTITIKKDKAYSLFITNEKNKEQAEYVLINDDLTKPAEGKAKIRFVHLSPDGEKLNLAFSDGTELFKEAEFKSATDFKEIDAAKKSLDIIDQESEEVLVSLKDIDLKAGKIYTVWVKGLVDTEDDDQRIEVLVFINK
jgi:hypothetical protein